MNNYLLEPDMSGNFKNNVIECGTSDPYLDINENITLSNLITLIINKRKQENKFTNINIYCLFCRTYQEFCSKPLLKLSKPSSNTDAKRKYYIVYDN